MNENETLTEEIIDEALPSLEEEQVPDITTEEEPSIEFEDIKALKEQLAALQLQLEESRAMYDKFHADCMEFSQLYPSVSLSSIPDSIWDSVRSGVPLAAAYALAEKKEALANTKAENVNSKNKSLSSGSLTPSKREEFFSPAEVRAMSAPEVRANYAKIIASMSKWH